MYDLYPYLLQAVLSIVGLKLNTVKTVKKRKNCRIKKSMAERMPKIANSGVYLKETFCTVYPPNLGKTKYLFKT